MSDLLHIFKWTVIFFCVIFICEAAKSVAVTMTDRTYRAEKTLTLENGGI